MFRHPFLARPSAVADAPKAAVDLLAALAAAEFAPAGAVSVAAATAVAAAGLPVAAAADGARS
ncbi:hypothetical protein OHU45_03195 [Streptomyces tubercidicus]|uniref:hypothetical protein n=1 Tax=Streptomyces tubercidicus TaxID=47759 RepID=UPI002E0E699D|nr:hypothetical protein OG761_03020 [Streptomyces tubercidicus]WSX24395.1 hypothetical protein OG690_34320 [Streptomyces tubercidicus]